MKLSSRHALPLLLLGAGAPAFAQSEPCFLFPAGVAELTCTCGPGPHEFQIIGSNPYVVTSPICTAAVHAGVIGPEGGEVTVVSAGTPDLEDLQGSTANGVTSISEMYPDTAAFTFVGAPEREALPACGPLGEEAQLNCQCAPFRPLGEVSGSGPYTADSDICTAARHAGVIDNHGGEVTVERVAGQESYTGSTASGIEATDHGPSDASFIFVPNE